MGVLGFPFLNQYMFWFFTSFLWSPEQNSAETVFSFQTCTEQDKDKKTQQQQNKNKEN